jgi:hypothetical protein
MHQLTSRLPSEPKEAINNFTNNLTDSFADNFTTKNTFKYDSHYFYRVIINTGALKYSIAGYKQFQALQCTSSITLNKTTKGQVQVQFSINSILSIRFIIVKTPIEQVKFHIMYTKTLFLLSLADINKLKVYFNNLSNVIVTLKGDIPVIRRFRHSFLL